jgi:hypothetical protein
MVLYYCNLLFGLYPQIETSSIYRTQQSRFHLMTREEPSLETLWLQNIRTMGKVQVTDRSNFLTTDCQKTNTQTTMKETPGRLKS